LVSYVSAFCIAAGISTEWKVIFKCK
jgi:hypothetical protein